MSEEKICENSSCKKIHYGYSSICMECHNKYSKPLGKTGIVRKINRDKDGKNIQ